MLRNEYHWSDEHSYASLESKLSKFFNNLLSEAYSKNMFSLSAANR